MLLQEILTLLPDFTVTLQLAEELPEAAVRYIRYIEREVGVPVKYVSVGANREDIIVL